MKNTDLYLKPGTYIKASTTTGDVSGISLENFVVGVLNNPTCCPKPPGSPDGMLMTALPLNLILQTVTDFVGNNSAIQLSTLRLGIRSDSSVTTQTSSVIQATTTNANLVIAPNGTGALIAQIPDGTATGGNARGANAVDLQMVRNAATAVASGAASVISGGIRNQSSNTYSTVSGGYGNVASGSTATVVGGNGNTASGEWSVTGGRGNTASAQDTVVFGQGNNATSSFSTVSGGQSNTASTGTHATVVGGSTNTSSGAQSISGGLSSVASGSWSVALGRSLTVSSSQHGTAFGFNNNVSGEGAFAAGRDNTIAGTRAAALGSSNSSGGYAAFSMGESNSSSADYSTSLGNYSFAYLRGQIAVASGRPTAQGQAFQQSLITAFREDTLATGATTILSLDGTGTTNFIIPNGSNRSWNVQVRWVAVVTAITGMATGVTVGDTKVSTDLLAVAKRAGTTTVGAHTSAGTSVIETTAGSLTTVNIVYSAGASQQMAITFTGPTFVGGGSVTMRVTAAISLAEAGY
jgi:hypothetical protein